jgi:8-oxo-dGTP pyrophosphatase MutT (NUDIX family)
VLLGVVAGDGPPRVLLTKRAATLRHHPGQIALPGGKVDEADRSAADPRWGGAGGAVAAALRESHEEVGLPTGAVEVLGTFGPHATVTGFSVTAVLALLAPFSPVPERGEVDEVFALPLAHVLDLDAYRIESRAWGGRRRGYWVLPFGPWYVWGATARILRSLAERAA